MDAFNSNSLVIDKRPVLGFVIIQSDIAFFTNGDIERVVRSSILKYERVEKNAFSKTYEGGNFFCIIEEMDAENCVILLTLPPLKQGDSQFTDRSVLAVRLMSVLHNLPEREFPYALRYFFKG